ncbi:MAG: JAB domain-containing protein [Proteobacteria bacterium]|nr:JAB domain-containing protein [Pseudomonadota bacterium]
MKKVKDLPEFKRPREKLKEPEDALLPLLADIMTKQQEYFVCISLNGANEVIEKRIVTVDLLNKTQVHPREVFADVITDRAAAVILAHNHPSGELKASTEDLALQRQLVESGRILDHIIVTRKGHLSFQAQGFI